MLSWFLRVCIAELDYKELNVLATWLTGTAERFPPRRQVAYEAAKLAWESACKAYQDGIALPHEYGLALVLFAKASQLLGKPRYASENRQCTHCNL